MDPNTNSFVVCFLLIMSCRWWKLQELGKLFLLLKAYTQSLPFAITNNIGITPNYLIVSLLNLLHAQTSF